jgi:hypothetical protein
MLRRETLVCDTIEEETGIAGLIAAVFILVALVLFRFRFRLFCAY